MINYNSKEWLLGIFMFKKGDTLRQLFPAIIGVCIYTAGIVYAERSLLHLPDSSPVRNFGILQTLLSFVISMLLVFRTNTAYDRWWEGRKHWGALVNNCRNLAVKINAMLPHHDERNRSFYRRLIPAFCHALRLHLQSETTRLALDTDPHPEIPDFDHTRHVPNQIAGLMIGKANMLYRDGVITGDQLITLNNELQSFLDICGACERIKNTPIPYSYSVFIKKFIFIYTATLPIGLVYSLNYLLVPVVALVFYVLASLEMIAEEIEDPFGTDPNDLPMEKISDNISRNVHDILR